VIALSEAFREILALVFGAIADACLGWVRDATKRMKGGGNG
jgi:hypothetical protein